MYNQYIPAPREEVHSERQERRPEATEAMAPQPPQPHHPPHPHPHQQQPPRASAFGSLSQALGSRLGTIRFDADTLRALAVIWFLISDGEEFDTELILMIGILLVLGL